MADLANYLFRALVLLGLAIAPRLLSPDPATPKNFALALLVPLIALGGLLAGAFYLKKRLDSREARIAAGLIWVSVAAALAASVYFTGAQAPLGRGAPVVALLVWPAMAALAAALAGEYLGSNWKHKRSAAAALVLSGGLFVHADGAKNMGDAAHMWSVALTRDPANEGAFDRVTKPMLLQGKLDDVTRRATARLRADPAACSCLVARATVAQKRREPEKALQTAAEAAKICPQVTAARAAHAEALLLNSKLEAALAEADEALLLGDDPRRAHAARASVLMAAGRVQEATEEAKKAADGSSQRDAHLLLASIALGNGDLDGAEASLKTLFAANPKDTDVVYNLALIADKRDNYNEARSGYLAALKIDPTYKAARYNVALLTWRRGVLEEAKNHARKYAEIAPNDPSAATLAKTISGQPPKSP